MKIFKVFLACLFFSGAHADESWEPKINDLSLQFFLGGEFGQTNLSVILGESKENIALISVSLGLSKHIVGSSELKEFRKPDLNSLRVYIDGARKIDGKESESMVLDKIYDFKGFSLCIPYGDYTGGKRLGKSGYFRNILQIKFLSDSYKIYDLDVASQELPTSTCTINK